MTLTIAMPLDAKPACADHLDLVDAAFDKPGGPAGHRLTRLYCRRCPVGTECLFLAMRGGEPGPWGGTAPKTRTQAGGRPTRSPGNSETNLIGVRHR